MDTLSIMTSRIRFHNRSTIILIFASKELEFKMSMLLVMFIAFIKKPALWSFTNLTPRIQPMYLINGCSLTKYPPITSLCSAIILYCKGIIRMVHTIKCLALLKIPHLVWFNRIRLRLIWTTILPSLPMMKACSSKLHFRIAKSNYTFMSALPKSTIQIRLLLLRLTWFISLALRVALN